MSADKKQLGSTADTTASLGIAGKTITSVSNYRHGSVEVVDIFCTDTVHYYVKLKQGLVEIGGTADWGSGTQVGGR